MRRGDADLARIEFVARERRMTRDDVLVWLSFAWFVALCGAAIWVLFWPAYNIFE
jgi:hypothetical protein